MIDIIWYYVSMEKTKDTLITRTFTVDRQLLDLLAVNAKRNERNLSSELRYRLRKSYETQEGANNGIQI